jgi:WD40 repeat protein
VAAVAHSSNGRHIISGCYDGTIRIWDAETGAAIGKPIEAHGRGERGVVSLAYSPNGRHITSGTYYGIIRIWDIEKSAAVGKPLGGILGVCSPLLTLLMAGTSSLDPLTGLFGSGIPRPVVRLANL